MPSKQVCEAEKLILQEIKDNAAGMQSEVSQLDWISKIFTRLHQPGQGSCCINQSVFKLTFQMEHFTSLRCNLMQLDICRFDKIRIAVITVGKLVGEEATNGHRR